MAKRKDKIPTPPFTPGKYRHYKGNDYEAIGLACREDNHEWYVVYKPLYEHEGLPDIWLRKYDDFLSTVSVDGKEVPRFSLLDDK